MQRRRLASLTPALLLAASGCGVTIRQPGGSGQSGGAAVPAEDVPRLGVDAAHAEVLAGKAVLVDVRSAEAYQRSRARGAILLPLEQIESSPQGTAGGLPAGLRPVLYCT
ncbi:MAG TPA: rhodanese-like domain-containing protein [Chloroflexota bacterium]|nr:rhodanese-like domain-containing protein [Chloroflexota bacterium]